MQFVSHSPTEWFTKPLIKSCLKNIHIPELRMTLTVHDCIAVNTEQTITQKSWKPDKEAGGFRSKEELHEAGDESMRQETFQLLEISWMKLILTYT